MKQLIVAATALALMAGSAFTWEFSQKHDWEKGHIYWSCVKNQLGNKDKLCARSMGGNISHLIFIDRSIYRTVIPDTNCSQYSCTDKYVVLMNVDGTVFRDVSHTVSESNDVIFLWNDKQTNQMLQNGNILKVRVRGVFGKQAEMHFDIHGVPHVRLETIETKTTNKRGKVKIRKKQKWIIDESDSK